MGGDHDGGDSGSCCRYGDRTRPWMDPSAWMPRNKWTSPIVIDRNNTKFVGQNRAEEEVKGGISHGGEDHVDVIWEIDYLVIALFVSVHDLILQQNHDFPFK